MSGTGIIDVRGQPNRPRRRGRSDRSPPSQSILLSQELLDPAREFRLQVAFRGAVHTLHQRALLVDEEAGGYRIHAIEVADGAAGIPSRRKWQTVLLCIPAGCGVLVPGRIHAQQLEALVTIPRIKLGQNGSLPLTMGSGGVPEVHQDGAAPEARQGDAVAIQEP